MRGYSKTGLLLAVVITWSGCTASRYASNLATVTSGHVNDLNRSLQSYVADAKRVHQVDAARIADAQIRIASDIASNQQIITAWNVGGQVTLLKAYEVLQKQADTDMSITESNIKRRAAAMASIEASLNNLDYDPEKLSKVTDLSRE